MCKEQLCGKQACGKYCAGNNCAGNNCAGNNRAGNIVQGTTVQGTIVLGKTVRRTTVHIRQSYCIGPYSVSVSVSVPFTPIVQICLRVQLYLHVERSEINILCSPVFKSWTRPDKLVNQSLASPSTEMEFLDTN